MNRFGLAVLTAASLLLTTSYVQADYLEVSRTANLRDQPASAANWVSQLAPGAVLRLLENDETNGYYHAAPYSGGQAGWIYRTFVRRWAGDPDNAPESTSPLMAPPTREPSAGGADASAFAIPNCPPEGNPSPRGPNYHELISLNEAKNRMRAPLDSELHPLALSAIMAQGDDRDRWNNSMAVEVEGYVVLDTSGGKETCNCKNVAEKYHDTHIELTQGPDDQELPMIVEVTPEWRGYMGQFGKDWSTDGLRSQIERHWVRVRGWMLFDSEHVGNSENTNPDGSNLWRRTAWEIHPVTDIEVKSDGTWISLAGGSH